LSWRRVLPISRGVFDDNTSLHGQSQPAPLLMRINSCWSSTCAQSFERRWKPSCKAWTTLMVLSKQSTGKCERKRRAGNRSPGAPICAKLRALCAGGCLRTNHLFAQSGNGKTWPRVRERGLFRGDCSPSAMIWAKLSPAGAIVTEHKFKIGRLVLFHPKGKGLPQLDPARGTYQVIRRMPPAEDGEFQYEIRSNREGHNRVAKESELTPA
jgi:hypothetical protein